MSLDVAYCSNLMEQKNLEIEKQVRKNRLELKLAIFPPFLPFPMVPMPRVTVFSVEGFSSQQIVRNARDQAESAVAKKLPGTKMVFYLCFGGEARLFFKYAQQEKGAIEVIGESDKENERRMIDNFKKNYKSIKF